MGSDGGNDVIILVENNSKASEVSFSNDQSPNISANEIQKQQKQAKHKKEMKCTKCGKIFDRVYRLNRHLQTHKEIKSFACSLCARRFARHDTMEEHFKTVHLKKNKHELKHCGASFRRPGRLQSHIKCKHSK